MPVVSSKTTDTANAMLKKAIAESAALSAKVLYCPLPFAQNLKPVLYCPPPVALPATAKADADQIYHPCHPSPSCSKCFIIH